jgi:TniQ
MTQYKQKPGAKGDIYIQSRRLVARSGPETDESLYGWAVRLADANGYANAKAILSLARRGASAPSAGTLSSRLAQLVGGSPSDFERYVSNNEICRSYHGLELGVGVQAQYFDARPKVCPACLADRAVLRSVWNLTIWHYCPQHACRLIQACPFCRKSLARGQRAVTHCGNRLCAANISRCASDPIPNDIKNMVVTLGDIASGRRCESFPELPESFKDTSLRDFVILIDLLSRPLLRDNKESSQDNCAREKLKITQDALTDWPHGYHQFLHSLRSLRLEYSRSGKSLLDQTFPFLLANLVSGHSGLADAILDGLKEELASYVEEHVPYAMDARFRLTGKPSRWVTLRRAARELGLSPYKVTRAQREGVIQTTTSSLPTKLRYFIERDYIANTSRSEIFFPIHAFKAKYNLVSVARAAKLLQTSLPVIRSLIQTGYIETLTHSGATWCKAASMNDLLIKLTNVAIHAAGDEGRWTELTRSQSISAAEVTDVLQLALDGQLQLKLKGNGCRGLRSFLFNRDHLIKLFPVLPEGYVGVAEASRHPYLSKKYLSTAIRSGLLPSVEHPRKRRMVELNALAAFRAKYVGCKELAEIFGVMPNLISVELKDGAAFVNTTGRRVWYREHALEILGKKYHRIEKGVSSAGNAAKIAGTVPRPRCR